jgi:anti-anti-sigma factor
VTDFGLRAQPGTGGVLRLVLSGEVDMATAVQIPEATDKALSEHATEVLIDLAAVTFLDSTGMRALLTAQRIAAESRVPLRVVGAQGGVERVLTITGLLDVLEGHDPLG